MAKTTFRPEIDGFAFDNYWNIEVEENRQIHDVLSKVLPAAVALLATVLLSIAPAVIAVAAPILALIPFLDLAASPLGLIIAAAVAGPLINTAVDAFAKKFHAFCAGMAYA